MSAKPMKDTEKLVFLAREPDPEPNPDEEELDFKEGKRRDDQFALRLAKDAPEGIGNRVRYDHSIGIWYIWDKARWAPDTKRDIHELLRRCLNRWLKATTDSKVAQDLAVLMDMRKQQTVLESLSTMPPVKATGTEFDTHPHLLGVKNGTVDLTTGELKEGDQNDLITKSTNIEYKPELAGKAKMFEEFLLQVFSRNKAMVEYVKLALGATMFGHIQPQEFYVCEGVGGNGKGVLMNLFGFILGDYTATPPRTLYQKTRHGEAPSNAPRADLIALYGKRFAHVSEPEGQLNEAALKEHTGDDVIWARDLHTKARNAISFLPTFTLWFRTNKPPQIEDNGTAMQRRARVIPFRQEFTGDDREDGIENRLKTEAEAIQATLVQYAMKYHKNPASIRDLPEDVRDASEEQVRNKDPLARWLVERCIIESGHQTTFADLYADYKAWAVPEAVLDPDITVISETACGINLRARFRKGTPDRPRSYAGLSLKFPPTETQTDDDN